MFIAGWTYGSLFNKSNKGKSDAFLAKYSAAGTLLWDVQLASSENDGFTGLATDNAGNVYAVGNSSGSLFSEKHFGSFDTFIVKFSATGKKQWHKWLATNKPDIAKSVVVDSAQNVYFLGHSQGSLFGQNQGLDDIFLVKYAANGDEKWHKTFASKGKDTPWRLAADSQENVYMIAFSNGDLFANKNQGGIDSFLLKLDKSGNIKWQKSIAGKQDQYILALAVDKSDNVFIAGTTSIKLFNQKTFGFLDAFVVEYDKAGNRIWTKVIGTDKNDEARAVALDNSGGVYLAGYSAGSLYPNNKGGLDAYIVKFK